MSSENVMATNHGHDEPQGHTLNQIIVTDVSSLTRTVAGTAIGNFTEWFDFGIYSYLILIIAQVFFPKGSGLAMLASFAGLAMSFLIRPIGGIFWGIMGDRIGRKKVLAYTLLLMAFGTLIIGLLPSYASIGIWSPILLFVLRGIQGFSTGGEYISAMTFLVEHAPDKKRGHLLSFLPVGTLSGYILGASMVFVIQASLSHAAMLAWGWRIPFLVAGPLGFIGFYVRLSFEESLAYKQQKQAENGNKKNGLNQLKPTIVKQWRPILICMGLVLSFNVTNYMLTGYMPTYLPAHVGVHKNNALFIIAVVMVVLMLIVTFLARLSDRIGRKPIMFTGSIMLTFVSVPMFLLIFQGSNAAIFIGNMLMGLMLVCFMSTEPSTLPTLFPTNVRSRLTATAYNISVSAFGGTTPLIAEALVESTGNTLMPAYILVVAGIVGIISVYFTPEPSGKPLMGSGPIVENEEETRKLGF